MYNKPSIILPGILGWSLPSRSPDPGIRCPERKFILQADPIPDIRKMVFNLSYRVPACLFLDANQYS